METCYGIHIGTSEVCVCVYDAVIRYVKGICVVPACCIFTKKGKFLPVLSTVKRMFQRKF